MDLLKNPFHILGATTRDHRHRIIELAEERSLLGDANECAESRSILITPSRRISAEVAWLPGVDPTLYDEILRHLDSPNQIFFNINRLTHIARANLCVSELSRLSNLLSSNIMERILTIAQTSEAINSDTVCAILNDDRRVSGFPEITDLSVIDDEIRKQRRYYSQTVTSVLENLPVNARARVMILLLETSTSNGRHQCPILIKDLIPAYELGVQDSLEQQQKIIEAQDAKLRAMADAKNPNTTLTPIVDQLLESVKEWDVLAQPIQLSQRSTGQRHDASFEMAWRVRDLAIALFNEHDKRDFSRKILNTLKSVFAEVPEIAEQITKDLTDLEKQISFIRGVEKFEEIKSQVEKLEEASNSKQLDYILTPMVNQLIQTVKSWNTTTQPVEANEAVAFVVRGIALHLWNEHQKLDFAIQITNMLFDIFVSSKSVGVEIAARLAEDKAALIKIDAQRKIAKVQRRTDTQRPADTGCLLQIIIFAILGLIGALLQGC